MGCVKSNFKEEGSNGDLTPLQQKSIVAASFLQRKLVEYEQLRREIESLRSEVEQVEVQEKRVSEE
jgi:hypothetical protein